MTHRAESFSEQWWNWGQSCRWELECVLRVENDIYLLFHVSQLLAAPESSQPRPTEVWTQLVLSREEWTQLVLSREEPARRRRRRSRAPTPPLPPPVVDSERSGVLPRPHQLSSTKPLPRRRAKRPACSAKHPHSSASRVRTLSDHSFEQRQNH